jgi:hypothetical protein
MGINLPSFCNFKPKTVQIGLTISTVTMMVVLIICYSTFGWIDDDGYTTSLKEQKVGGHTSDLTGDAKTEADTMAGLGAMAFIFLFLDLVILVILLLDKFSSYKNLMVIGGLVCTGLAWLFLTAGWGRFADSNGGASSSVDFGASFAFTVITWLCLFPYAFFWFWLWNNSNDAESDTQAQADGTPAAEQYAGSGAPSFTANNAGATSTAQPADGADPVQEPAPASEGVDGSTRM